MPQSWPVGADVDLHLPAHAVWVRCQAPPPPIRGFGARSHGSYRARVLPPRLDDDLQRRRLVHAAAAAGVDDPFAAHWLELGTFVVEAGQYRSVEMQLPRAWRR